MKLRRLLMGLMVFMMRWMTRFLGFIARPLVRLVAANEVIACGLRDEAGRVRVIYSPRPGRGAHRVVRLNAAGGAEAEITTRPASDFAGGLVRQVLLPEARQGEVVRVQADNAAGRLLNSPRITVKKETRRDPGLIEAEYIDGGQVKLRWPRATRRGAMVYFLALQDEAGRGIAGVYTRETFWTYPRLRSASLSIGPEPPPVLTAGAPFTAKLVVVDFDGWVSGLATRTFTIPS